MQQKMAYNGTVLATLIHNLLCAFVYILLYFCYVFGMHTTETVTVSQDTLFFLYAKHGAHSDASQNVMCHDSQITNQQFKFNYVGTNFSLLGIRGNVIAFMNIEACNSSCPPPFFGGSI